MPFSIKCSNSDVKSRISQEISNSIHQFGNLFNVTNLFFEIRVHESRASFDNVLGRKTEEWEVGNTKGNIVEILSPNAFNRESSHKENEFLPILKHEICHIFYFSRFNASSPMWLNEGLCSFYCTPKTGKILFKKLEYLKTISLDNMHSSAEFRQIDSLIRYELAWALLNEIVYKFGENKLNLFLKNLGDVNNKEAVQNVFKETFSEEMPVFWNKFISKIEEGLINKSTK